MAGMRRPDPPSLDKRWRMVSATMRRNGYHRHALIETLHTVQDAFSYIDDDALRAFDPCLSCSTHAWGKMQLLIELRDGQGQLLNQLRRD